LLREVRIADLCPEPSEVTAIALIPARALERLASGRKTHELAFGGAVDNSGRVTSGSVPIAAATLVPRTGNYYLKAARFARGLASGKVVVRRRRWW
jgi:hypothetical protein